MSCASMLPVAVLAGGLATRLRPVTATSPKALISVAGEPFIWHQLRLLRREGVERVVAVRRPSGPDGPRFCRRWTPIWPGCRLQLRWRQASRDRGRATPCAADSGRRLLRALRRQLSRCSICAGSGGVSPPGGAGTHDGLSQRRALGHQQCRVPGRSRGALRQARRGGRHALHRLWTGHPDARGARPVEGCGSLRPRGGLCDAGGIGPARRP